MNTESRKNQNTDHQYTDQKKLRISTLFRHCVKDRKISDNGEKLHGHIKIIWRARKFGMNLT